MPSVKMNEGPCIQLTAAAALGLFLRVTAAGALAGVSDVELGTIEVPAAASGDFCTVRLRNSPGTQLFIAAGAITSGGKVFAAASGKVNDVPGGVYIGRAMNATTADGDWIEVLRDAAEMANVVETKTADYTVTVDDSGKTFDTTGAAGAVTFALPAATPGMRFRFRVGAAQQLRIDPNGTETIALPSTGVASAAGAYIVADAAGETVDIMCVVAGTWNVFGFTGTWTAV